MFVQLNDENRIIGTCETNCFPKDTKVMCFEFPDDFDFGNQNEYLIIDGVLVERESEIHKKYREEEEQSEKNNELLRVALDTIAEQDDAICTLYEMVVG